MELLVGIIGALTAFLWVGYKYIQYRITSYEIDQIRKCYDNAEKAFFTMEALPLTADNDSRREWLRKRISFEQALLADLSNRFSASGSRNGSPNDSGNIQNTNK